ncbi:hypothetical protein OHB06_31025 [Streptomyces sp. NBC_01604]|uniref:hypothetical protein n=1 Tax=Streptomyces sp. NBC_01604 TaxID=2975894 RepID=UPI003864D573
MFGLDGSYHPTAMFLAGLASAPWLVRRKGEESSFVWTRLVLEDAFPDAGVRH